MISMAAKCEYSLRACSILGMSICQNQPPVRCKEVRPGAHGEAQEGYDAFRDALPLPPESDPTRAQIRRPAVPGGLRGGHPQGGADAARPQRDWISRAVPARQDQPSLNSFMPCIAMPCHMSRKGKEGSDSKVRAPCPSESIWSKNTHKY